MTAETDHPIHQRAPRYAVYAMPADDFGRAGAEWLGWDAQSGTRVAQPDLPGLPRPLSELALRACRYGFHATIKAPMALAKGHSYADLLGALKDTAARLRPVEVSLELRADQQFVAFRPSSGDDDVRDLAAQVVSDLDPLRAPLSERDITRRNPGALTPRQQELLVQVGYPYAMEEYNLHVTLTEQLSAADLGPVMDAARQFFAGRIPDPWHIDRLCLLAEDQDGFFHVKDSCQLG